MILTCPACQKRYMVESREIGSKGRIVRCVSCRHTWHQTLDEDIASLNELTNDFFNENETLSISRKHSTVWFLILVSLTLLVGSLLIARNTIVAYWPSAEQVFTKLGLSISHPAEGLMIENITPLQMTQDGLSRIVLKGELVNTSHLIRTIPALHIIVKGDCSRASIKARLGANLRQLVERIFNSSNVSGRFCVLEKWDYKLSESRLFPSERLSFETTPHTMIDGAKDITIEF